MALKKVSLLYVEIGDTFGSKRSKFPFFFSMPTSLEALFVSLILTKLSCQTSTSSDILVHQYQCWLEVGVILS